MQKYQATPQERRVRPGTAWRKRLERGRPNHSVVVPYICSGSRRHLAPYRHFFPVLVFRQTAFHFLTPCRRHPVTNNFLVKRPFQFVPLVFVQPQFILWAHIRWPKPCARWPRIARQGPRVRRDAHSYVIIRRRSYAIMAAHGGNSYCTHIDSGARCCASRHLVLASRDICRIRMQKRTVLSSKCSSKTAVEELSGENVFAFLEKRTVLRTTTITCNLSSSTSVDRPAAATLSED